MPFRGRARWAIAKPMWMPEAADGGPIALVKDGDTVSIDVAARRIDLELDDQEFAARRAALSRFVSSEKKGWLALYQDLVQPLTKGGTLKPGRRAD